MPCYNFSLPQQDFDTNWRIYDGYTTPLLKAFLTKVTVSSTGLRTVYNGQAQQLSTADLSYSSTVDMSKVWKTAQATQTNAGSYSLANMLYSSQDGYDFTSTDVYTIEPKTITATVTGSVTKTYDGKTDAAALDTNYQLSGLVGQDSATLTSASAASTYNSKDVATADAVTYGGLTLSNANYTLGAVTSITGAGKITPKTITATLPKRTGLDKVYDGNASSALGTNYAFGATDIVSGDTVHLIATGSYDNKNVGEDKAVTYTNLNLDNGNYQLANTVTSFTGTGTITPKTITATLTNTTGIDKVYDGSTSSAIGANYAFGTNDIVSGDTVNLSAIGRYDS